MTPVDPSSPSAAPTTASAEPGKGAAFVDRMAHWMKMLSLYPAGSERVKTSENDFLTAAEPVVPTKLVFREGMVLVGREEVTTTGHERVRWLAQHFRACGASTVEIQAGDLAHDIRTLMRWLLDNTAKARQGQAIDPFPAGKAGGLRVEDRRFTGAFGGTAGSDEGTGGGHGDGLGDGRGVADGSGDGAGGHDWGDEEIHRLGAQQEIVERLSRILDRLVQTDPDAPEANDIEERIKKSILRFVIRSLPDDMRSNHEQATMLTQGMLEAVESFLDSQGLSRRQIASLTESEIRATVYAASRIYFGREDDQENVETEEDTTPRLRGHPGDDAISEDIPSMLREMRTFPAWTRGELTLADTRNAEEELRVLLGYVAHDFEGVARETLKRRLTRRLSRAGPLEFDHVASAAQGFLTRADGIATLDHIIGLFQEARLTWVLHRSGVLHTDMVVESFPKYFPAYVDALAVFDQHERKEFQSVLLDVGVRRFRDEDTLTTLEQVGFFDEGRPHRLIATGALELAPLIPIFLSRDPEGAGEAVHAWLQQVRPAEGHAALLSMPYDPAVHTAPWLGALVDAGPSGRIDNLAVVHGMTVLRRLTKDAKAPIAQRTQVVGILEKLATPESVELLKQCAKEGRGWFKSDQETRPLREAAERALDRLKRSGRLG